ncbi:MAG: hypothetical protein WDM89_22455 [Rhizomicrobium sp.]
MRATISFGLIALVLLFVGCSSPNSKRITIIARACVVQGAPWDFGAGKATPATTRTNAATQVILDASQIWQTGADIAFVPVLDSQGEIPEIRVQGSDGKGDIDQPQDSSPTPQTKAAIQACDAAWQSTYPKGLLGIPMIFARTIVNDDGSNSRQNGIEPQNTTGYARNGGKDLCDRPYKIVQGDLTGNAFVIATLNVDRVSSSSFAEALATTTAHEIGHSLMLAHGDGRDNDNNGRWDQVCDPLEYSQYDLAPSDPNPSIMNAAPSNQTLITPLQAELARSAAQFVPGVVGGPFP